jgi:malate dehydrogenase (decarboxylating)
MEELFYDLSNFAAEENDWEGMALKEVVENVKPDILIGLSGCGGIFTGEHAICHSFVSEKSGNVLLFFADEILTTMGKNCTGPPIIFSLSNPTSRSECSAEQAQVMSSFFLCHA